MTIKELKEKLAKFDNDLEICPLISDRDEVGEIDDEFFLAPNHLYNCDQKNTKKETVFFYVY